MNKFLRTASTRRLLASIVGVILAIAAGTTIAIAAQGSGPVPAAKGLPNAIRGALGGPKVQGVNAHITFTNHLINTSEIQGTDPLLSGGTGQLWLSDKGQLRVELYGDNGDPAVVVNNNAWWISDPSTSTVYEGTLPAQKADKKSSAAHDSIPTVAQVQSGLTRLARRLNISRAVPGDVAGQPAYTVTVSPKHSGGLLGQVQLAWDAIHGVPLQFSIYAKGDSSPVLGITATGINYGPVDPSIFSMISPPAGYKVVKVATPAAAGHAGSLTRAESKGRHAHADVSGAKAVAARVPFKLVAPRKLVGLPRQSVSLLASGAGSGALITYGQNLGGILVIEQPASTTAPQSAAPANNTDGGPGLSLPTVTIHHATGQELDTALGTMIRFTRAGVSYTVLGSVPAVAADAAARAL